MIAKVKVKGATYIIPADRVASEIVNNGAKEDMVITHEGIVVTVISGIIECSNESYLKELLPKVSLLQQKKL